MTRTSPPLAATGARFTSMTGYLHGDLIDPSTADEVVRTAELSIKAAETLGVPRLNLHTAELVDGNAARPRYRATGEMWTDRAAHARADRRTRRGGRRDVLRGEPEHDRRPPRRARWRGPKTRWLWSKASDIPT